MKTIGIIGAGTMGSGIAEVAALAGFTVLLHDTDSAALHRAVERIGKDLHHGSRTQKRSGADAAAARALIHALGTLEELAGADFIIEAAVEDLRVKAEIFRRLGSIVARDAILATNTSSLPVTAIASHAQNPESVVGMHFFNPPTILPLVEIVRTHSTSTAALHATIELALAMGKKPIVCKDTPGFIVNRVARPFYGEALRILGDGIAGVEIIDRIARESGGFRMGPFELMDLIGIDVNYAVTCSVYEQFFQEPRFRPHPLQRAMVESGRLGRKTKEGFYRY